MTERDMESRLRAFLHSEAQQDAMPASLRLQLAGIPQAGTPDFGLLRSRRAMLLVAVILTAILAAGAVAVGSGLIRLPEITEAESLGQLSAQVISGPYSQCASTLPDDVVLEVQRFPASGPPERLVVADSGLALRGPLYPDMEGMGPWSQRQLTSDGLGSLVSAMEESGLTRCQAVPAVGFDRFVLTARTSAGIDSMRIGDAGMRIATPAELSAAEALAVRFNDRDLGVPAADWVDSGWLPYALDRWEVRVGRWEGSMPLWARGVTGWQSDADIVFPDGSGPETFGSPIPGIPAEDILEERCRVLGADEADAFRAALGTTKLGPYMWGFVEPQGGVRVAVSPLLAPEPGCESHGPPAPRVNLIQDLDVCGYLPEALTAEVVPEPWKLMTYPATAEFGGGWTACEYWQGWVFASRHPITSEEAAGIAENQFGAGGFVTDEIAGRTVFLNACEGSGVTCWPAIAISAEPHFVIVQTPSGEAALRALATVLIERLNE